MRDKREARKILKAFGKAIYQERIHYVDTFAVENPSFLGRISYRHMMKRCLLVAMILILTFSMLVIGANALGIKFLNLSFLEFKDHTEVTMDKSAGKTAEETRFYELGYVPEGYELIGRDGFLEQELSFVYENGEGVNLYIDQSVSDTFSANLNNEDCEITTEVIGELEARVARYHNTEEGSSYLLRKGNIYIYIYGVLEDEEFIKIISGLKFKDHTEVTADKSAGKTTEETRFYELGYVPEGYELTLTDDFENIMKTYVYQNKEGIYLYIDQALEDSFSAQIDNEDCKITTEIIGDMEARFYRYFDEDGGTQCLVRKGSTYILILGFISDEEIRKVIHDLQ